MPSSHQIAHPRLVLDSQPRLRLTSTPNPISRYCIQAWCPCCHYSCHKVFCHLARLLRLLTISFLVTLALTRFMFVLLRNSKVTKMLGRNETCTAVPTYRSSQSFHTQALLDAGTLPYPAFTCSNETSLINVYQESCILATSCDIKEIESFYTM